MADLREDLLALDDVRRDDLPSQRQGAAMAVDEWLHREHGVMSSHHGLGLLLALLDAEGYAVVRLVRDKPLVPVVTEDEVAMYSAVLDVEEVDR